MISLNQHKLAPTTPKQKKSFRKTYIGPLKKMDDVSIYLGILKPIENVCFFYVESSQGDEYVRI